jgi:hypothetical protein
VRLSLGLILPLLTSYKQLVHAASSSPLVATTEFTYGAPLYKGNAKIVADLATVEGALDKFDAYFDHGILDEEERVRFAHAFTKAYAKKHPASERNDLFIASADVLRFQIELKPPLATADPKSVLDAIEQLPHDGAVLSSIRSGQPVDRAHLRGDFKLFLDNIYNPRRYEDDVVKKARARVQSERPLVVELWTNGAIPGVFVHALQPHLDAVGGAIVLLPG